MPSSSAQTSLLDQARLYFAERLVKEFQPWLDAAMAGAQALNEKTAERTVAQARRDMLQDVMRNGSQWPRRLAERVQKQVASGSAVQASAAANGPATLSGALDLKLVDDDEIQREILISRLAQSMLDKGIWEFNALRARLTSLSQLPDLEAGDLFRPPVLAECVIDAWTQAGLALESWRGLEEYLVKACSKPMEAVWQETNKWLVERGVLPEVDLRGAIRRSDGSSTSPGGLTPEPDPAATRGGGASTRFGDTSVASAPMPTATGRSSVYGPTGHGGMGGGPTRPAGAGAAGPAAGNDPFGGGPRPPQSILHGHSIEDETRMMTRPAAGASARADVVLEHFSEVMERHLPGFRDTAHARPASARLSEAMAKAQQRLVEQAGGPAGDGAIAGGAAAGVGPAPEILLQELRDRQAALKAAASTPAERATVELVALLFQAILTEERIPAQLRVWFARLQMPTLRVAIAEPDFFSTADHPARRLIDRMGACVMGFEGGAEVLGTPLETEIKRVVQVVEAFPDTGRRVFQTVLNEFEKFLEGYFREQNEKSRAGVSLAQQVEQRETLAIQYTIELRKLLGNVPVHEGIREFMFHVWADVLATAAVRHGPQSDQVKTVRAAASELLWTASAKTNREDRAEVIRRVPPLLTTLRQGMASVGLAAEKQDKAIKSLNLALTAAFSARATAITAQQLDDLKQRLEMIEELLPEEDVEIDESWVLDSSSHQHEGLEIVADGGSMPSPAMLEWAAELQLGAAFTLDLRGRQFSVRLVWQGMSRQLSLFSAADGRCVLFQKARLAAFLQAGLLVPLQDESLTVAATRSAIEKIKADPARLLA
ncbi:DUF1631 family protein [Ideonella sp. YS5]|uniref:DUF1631 family protein n=1 Tax=Ideonella sp. YS5 TaxID=3453714 RepID=UPI003EEADF60